MFVILYVWCVLFWVGILFGFGFVKVGVVWFVCLFGGVLFLCFGWGLVVFLLVLGECLFVFVLVCGLHLGLFVFWVLYFSFVCCFLCLFVCVFICYFFWLVFGAWVLAFHICAFTPQTSTHVWLASKKTWLCKIQSFPQSSYQ